MEKASCPNCREKLDSHRSECPPCSEDSREIKKETPDTEYNYFSARDYSAPENYPGY